MSTDNAVNELTGLTNLEYHADRKYLSSSNLKMILKDIRRFEHEWLKNLKTEEATKDHFTEGSFVHSLILEPEKIVNEYAIYPGLRKAGKLYEAFKEVHGHKTIISQAQVHRCEKLYQSYQRTPLALEILASCLPEHSCTTKWLDVPVKCRYDGIVPGSHIVDIKTTSSPTDPEQFRLTVQQFGYDLSAALYCQIAQQTYKMPHTYYWVVLSKYDMGCMVYKASTETLNVGTALCVQALNKYKQCSESGIWQDIQETLTLSEEVVEI